jgi:hypothetical protein
VGCRWRTTRTAGWSGSARRPPPAKYRADLCHIWQDPNQSGGWSGWSNFGDATLDSTRPIDSITGDDGRIEVFAMRNDGTLLHRWQLTRNGGWNSGYFSHGAGSEAGWRSARTAMAGWS